MNRVVLTTAVFLGLLNAPANADNLGKGSFEVRASGGFNASNGPVSSPLPSYELQAAFGISKFFALTAGYTHDYLQDTGFGFFCLLPTPAACNQEFHNRIHEFMGGVRFSVPNPSPITPHVHFGMGAVRQTSDFSGSSRTEFGIAPGGGLDYKLSRHFGIGIDANFVKANRFTGFYHVIGGVFFRF
jgi:Outer membrane protein beta-barrel domain